MRFWATQHLLKLSLPVLVQKNISKTCIASYPAVVYWSFVAVFHHGHTRLITSKCSLIGWSVDPLSDLAQRSVTRKGHLNCRVGEKSIGAQVCR